MQRHEIPTVFVHGSAAPEDVRYAEDLLCDTCGQLPSINYSVLWVDAAMSLDNAFEMVVEVELGLGGDIISSRGAGATVRVAADVCMDELRRALARLDVGQPS
jgi:hypothetical protein